ncbi:hypothetical protein BV20DRAFT_950322 [Pilatotrama ljubarskyi]|nr:hypothetical protein BV20DRAFT_950322 [Pilatotrama ljubarskyi]
MSSHAQSSSPFSRLSRLALPFKTNPSSPLSAEPQSDDWYIPYHGPVEPPKDDRNTDSWGHLVSGWLMENDEGRTERSPRIRAMSNASRAAADEQKRKSTRVQTSFVKLDQAGGVGDTPVPARPRRSQEAPLHHRSSLASILSFGNKKAHKLQHSSSAGDLRGKEPVPPLPQDATYDSHTQPTFPRRHPYAYATPVPSGPPPPPVSSPVVTIAPRKNPSTSRFSVRLLDPRADKPTAPAYLLPERRPSRISIKASMSTPNLRQATGTAAVLPKGKQRWLSAETWCDALILPRPRFALRVVDGEGVVGSGRIVSPPESPLWPPGMESPLDAAGAKVLKKSQSAIQLSSRGAYPPSPPRPPPVRPEPVREEPEAGPSRAVPVRNDANTHLKPHRPKSFALDDLALPSPVPSLTKVLEDGRQLEEERKRWQKQATKSFGDKAARSVSRARAKSLGSRTRTPTHGREPSAFDVLAEATLLGSQRRRPTVHVRVRPPRPDGHGTTTSGFGTATATATGTGIATWTSASHGQTRSRGHAHSNSVGSVAHSRSDESFMWTPGHGRNHSLGKSALRMVRTTATTAAGLCGIAGGHDVDEERHKGKAPMDEKAAAMEEALKRDGTKVIHLRDQMPRRDDRGGGVVVITPPSEAGPRTTQHQPAVGPGGLHGVSPTPSGLSTSAEGVGIAISSPVPPEDPTEQEPIRIPHPYAQGATYPYYQRTNGRAPVLPAVRPARSDSSAAPSPTTTTGEESITRHRQPIVVHPYSPYAQVNHPFAAITGNDSTPVNAVRARPNKHLSVRPPQSSMFAELAPGQIREILPDEIQYSPFIPTPPVQLPEPSRSSNPSGHPYGPSSKRTSEWGFAEALSHTMQRPLSTDSGLGTSENHDVPTPERIKVSHVLEDSDDIVVLSPEQEPVEEDLGMLSPHSKASSGVLESRGRRPGVTREATQVSSNHTLASSPMENVNPPVFRKVPSASQRSFNSSGSSPGVVSQQSSPPLSPRPITNNDDLDRFRDLFYRPPESRTPSSEDSLPPISRRPSGNIPIELTARSTRTLSGLTSLARQLNENIEEMEAYEAMGEGYERDRASPMWGARYGGLGGQRPDDLGPEPTQVLSQSPPGLIYEREGTGTPLRLPIHANLALSQPSDNIPEDVESSRASSMLELPVEEDDENVRIGEVEAVSTPPVFATPKRFSTHLSAVNHSEGESPVDERDSRRIVSQQSSLGVPMSSDAARASFMTNTSGMSGLSDFPAPPNQITPGHMSILNAYFGEGAHDYRESHSDLSRPGLVRETSQATFGQQQMGEAL